MLAWPALSQAGVLGPLADLSYKDQSCSGARNLGSSPCLMASSVISGPGLTHDSLLLQRLLGKLGSLFLLGKYWGERTSVLAQGRVAFVGISIFNK